MRVIGLGAGGHAKVVIDTLQRAGRCQVVGLLEPKSSLWGTEVMGVPVLGDDKLLPELYAQGVAHAFIGVSGAKSTHLRAELYERARQHGYQMVEAIHPQAIVSPSAVLGHGPTIMAGAIVNAGARLGDNVIVNTGAIVEHDCVVADHVHIATGARLAGSVFVHRGAHIGLSASIRQGIVVGEQAVVGAGAVVVADVPSGIVVVGVPARALERATK